MAHYFLRYTPRSSKTKNKGHQFQAIRGSDKLASRLLFGWACPKNDANENNANVGEDR